MNHPDAAGQYQSLVKHFFGRFFDFEAVSSSQVDSIEKNALLFQILALLILPGIAKCAASFFKYGYYIYRPVAELDAATITDKCYFLSFSMILLGFLTVFEWETLFPDQKDYLILTVFPVATRTVFYAKVVALAAFLLLFTVAINIIPTLLFPSAVLDNNPYSHTVFARKIPIYQVIRYTFSHGISVLLGNIFIFLTAITLQGILLMLIPSKWARAISRIVRFLCLLLLLGALLSFWALTSVDQLIQNESPLAAFFPPIWFIGIYEILLGSHNPAMWRLAERAAAALSLAGALSILSYAMCYRRFMRRSVESGPGVSHSFAGIRAAGNFLLDRLFIGKSEERASFHFVGQTIFRSSRHVLYIGTFLAVGFIIAAVRLATATLSRDPSVFGHLNKDILSIPLILSFFLLVGMRVSFAIPVDLEANWLFRIAPIQRIRSGYKGVRKFLIGALIIPLFILAGLFSRLVLDWSIVLLHVCYGISLSLILIELLFYRFPKIPFTCSYLPGAAKIVILWPLYFLGFTSFAYAAANIEAWLLGHPSRFFYFYVPAAALWATLIYQNNKSSGAAIRFEEESKTAPVYLDLNN